MLNDALKAQLKTYLLRLQRPIELIASVDGSAKSTELLALLDDIAACSTQVAVVQRDDAERSPSFAIAAAGEAPRVRFAGLPLGHEFTSLVLALLQVGGHPPKLDPERVEQIRSLDDDLEFEVYMSLSCHNCPDVVQAVNTMAALNPRIRAVTVDGALFQDEVARAGSWPCRRFSSTASLSARAAWASKRSWPRSTPARRGGTPPGWRRRRPTTC
jgi:alkyl hydroperoxide reductase subunit F